MLPPPLTGPVGAPIMLLDSSGTLAFGIPPDHAIHQEALFEMPPAISKDNAEAAAAKPEHDNENDTDKID
jgi:hypothetical protein